MKSSIFWDITLLKINHCFGGISRLHLQGRRISQAKISKKEVALFATWLNLDAWCSALLSRLISSCILKEKGDMFLREVDRFSKEYMTLYPSRQKMHILILPNL
jgi:hypothetical protein